MINDLIFKELMLTKDIYLFLIEKRRAKPSIENGMSERIDRKEKKRETRYISKNNNSLKNVWK